MAGDDNIVDLEKERQRREDELREDFAPLTGNPENGDYLDWYRHLQRKGKVPRDPTS